MMRTLLALGVLLLSRLAFANPSTTFLWSGIQPFDGTGDTVMFGSAAPFCRSWVPILGITNATSLTAYFTLAGAAGVKCSFSIYSGNGATLIATTGGIPCDVSGVVQATGLTPFSLTPGVKYQQCWCRVSNSPPTVLAIGSQEFAGDIRNTLAVPLDFVASTSCDGSGNPPANLGTFTATGVRPAFVLIGTNAP